MTRPPSFSLKDIAEETTRMEMEVALVLRENGVHPELSLFIPFEMPEAAWSSIQTLLHRSPCGVFPEAIYRLAELKNRFKSLWRTTVQPAPEIKASNRHTMIDYLRLLSKLTPAATLPNIRAAWKEAEDTFTSLDLVWSDELHKAAQMRRGSRAEVLGVLERVARAVFVTLSGIASQNGIRVGAGDGQVFLYCDPLDLKHTAQQLLLHIASAKSAFRLDSPECMTLLLSPCMEHAKLLIGVRKLARAARLEKYALSTIWAPEVHCYGSYGTMFDTFTGEVSAFTSDADYIAHPNVTTQTNAMAYSVLERLFGDANMFPFFIIDKFDFLLLVGLYDFMTGSSFAYSQDLFNTQTSLSLARKIKMMNQSDPTILGNPPVAVLVMRADAMLNDLLKGNPFDSLHLESRGWTRQEHPPESCY